MAGTREGCTGRGGDPLPRQPWLLQLSTASACLWLAGCTELPTDGGAWTYVVLSLGVVAAGAYAIGRLHERLHGGLRDSSRLDSPVSEAGTAAQASALLDTDLAALVPSDVERARDLELQQERQQESENFSFTVSHDLRAPIRVVEGFTRIVKEDYGRLLDRVGNDHLDRVLGAATRMNLMIDALLTLARLSHQPLARQPVDLSQLAAYVVEDLQRGAPEREADLQIESGLQAHGDPTLLRLVLENLLGNAWKYTQRRPRAVISLQRVALAPAQRASGHGFAFVVRDNGAGFDMRTSERLFGLFQRLHSASDFPGHGVGLASVQRIVRRHGGEIWAEAEAGRGAAFFFTLAP